MFLSIYMLSLTGSTCIFDAIETLFNVLSKQTATQRYEDYAWEN